MAACWHRGGANRRAHGLPYIAADTQPGDAGADELQPVDRRHRQGPPGQRRSTRWAARWPLATDEAGIQFRILNRQQGPAVRATLAQADRILYNGDPPPAGEPANLWLFQQAVDDVMVEGGRGRAS